MENTNQAKGASTDTLQDTPPATLASISTDALPSTGADAPTDTLQDESTAIPVVKPQQTSSKADSLMVIDWLKKTMTTSLSKVDIDRVQGLLQQLGNAEIDNVSKLIRYLVGKHLVHAHEILDYQNKIKRCEADYDDLDAKHAELSNLYQELEAKHNNFLQESEKVLTNLAAEKKTAATVVAEIVEEKKEAAPAKKNWFEELFHS